MTLSLSADPVASVYSMTEVCNKGEVEIWVTGECVRYLQQPMSSVFWRTCLHVARRLWIGGGAFVVVKITLIHSRASTALFPLLTTFRQKLASGEFLDLTDSMHRIMMYWPRYRSGWSGSTMILP
ncbi:uncharacterized protein BJ212DRAFT_255698 [Suillus subaureus]|uniref:Uncharacterized protein n=1 Tax=Suillus subaureus TaxID=48587 RepID=A0A9P7E9X0_9AGAM|nr:uncharacterized protein BJ212DRAFT_255698 [Suillus subaureus]KAG1815105.1 hypothetical protein BJ212DRAFT_255698 [Suillus subaureus]